MGIYKDFLIFIIGFCVIIKSADLFTTVAENIAAFFKLPRVVIGLTIVSIATTMPEFTVSAISAYMGVGGIAVGNVTGSCLANIGLILAIAAIIRAVDFNPKVIKSELVFLIGVSLFSYLLMKDGILSFVDGALLLLLLIGFFSYIIQRELRGKNKRKDIEKPQLNLTKSIVMFLIGAVGVVLSAKQAIIPSGINIAKYFNVPEVVIGVSLIAVGTSLPELVTAIIASIKKMGELAAGNVIGANILNLLWVLGISSMIRPLNIDSQTQKITMPLVVLFALFLFLFSRTKFKLIRKEGIILVCLYSAYIFYIFNFAY